MDYIFTIGFPVGAPVSSLYGAPLRVRGFPRYSHILVDQDLAFTDIPESFNLTFEQEAA